MGGVLDLASQPFGQRRSAVVVLSPPSSWSPFSLPHWQGCTRSWNALGSVQHYSATTRTLVCYQHCFLLKPKHSIIPHTVKIINSVPAETRTSQQSGFACILWTWLSRRDPGQALCIHVYRWAAADLSHLLPFLFWSLHRACGCGQVVSK